MVGLNTDEFDYKYQWHLQVLIIVVPNSVKYWNPIKPLTKQLLKSKPLVTTVSPRTRTVTDLNLVGADLTSLEIKFKGCGSSMFKINTFWIRDGSDPPTQSLHGNIATVSPNSTLGPQTCSPDSLRWYPSHPRMNPKVSTQNEWVVVFSFFIYNTTHSDLITKILAREKDRQLCFVTLSLRRGTRVWSLCHRYFHYLVNGLLPKFAAHLVIVHSKKCVFLFMI